MKLQLALEKTFHNPIHFDTFQVSHMVVITHVAAYYDSKYALEIFESI